MGRTEFVNWAGNQRCMPVAIESPGTADAVARLVSAANERRGRVKTVGAGHSFTDAACTDGTLIRLDALAAVESIDAATGVAVVQAGITLGALSEQLNAAGRALPNLGDIDVQTVAGATATATHGTGYALGNLSSGIVGLEIVTGEGEVLWCDAEANPDIFHCARVGVGALGVVTRVAIETVPAFNLEAAEGPRDLDSIIDDWAAFARSADHAEFFWLPGHSACFVKQNSVTDNECDAQSRAKHFVDRILFENVALDVAMRTARRFPSTRDRVAGLLIKSLSPSVHTDKSYKVFASPRHVRFIEMEYGLPIDAVPEALRRVQALTDTLQAPPLFPVEVRVSAADDIPLSTAEGRDSGWIAVHQYKGVNYGDYFRGVEAIMNDYDGRPHWGKFHYQSAASLSLRYPQWDRFQEVRAKVDPNGVFANAYTDRVLGPVGY